MEKICPITHEVINELSTLECGHEFEKNAIDQWLEQNITCPLCRKQVREETKNISQMIDEHHGRQMILIESNSPLGMMVSRTATVSMSSMSFGGMTIMQEMPLRPAFMSEYRTRREEDFLQFLVGSHFTPTRIPESMYRVAPQSIDYIREPIREITELPLMPQIIQKSDREKKLEKEKQKLNQQQMWRKKR